MLSLSGFQLRASFSSPVVGTIMNGARDFREGTQ